MNEKVGSISLINGPVLKAKGLKTVQMGELLGVGDAQLVGEVIGMDEGVLTIQVYEETSGLRPGAPVYGTGAPLSVELGPGILKGIFDGIERPLPVIEAQFGDFIGRGMKVPSLDREKKWHFVPTAVLNTQYAGTAILGEVQETEIIKHKIMVPLGMQGQLTWLAPEGDYSIAETIARLKTEEGEHPLSMVQRWPVRMPRPVKQQLDKNTPLITGQRVLDSFFPIVKGGCAAIPGGFGTGKTVTQHQIAKWADADLVVYVGCGERGNEITEVLQEFPKLIDPRSGHALMERTVIIANTSNMQVAARDASIYTGITIAEYYRDMGYNVALMADSTSRWAEAMREISGRLEEMPAQEGYPAYLSSRLAEFYERAGLVETLNGAKGSVTLIGAVSPPGGDFSEPVTQLTKQYTRVFWALDKVLASARHFPSINWLSSYSDYVQSVADWWLNETHTDWQEKRAAAMSLLTEEDHLNQIVHLVGPDALPDEQRLVLTTSRLLREGFLQQSALDQVDTYASPEKQMSMLSLILRFHERALRIVKKGAVIGDVEQTPIVHSLLVMKNEVPNNQLERFQEIGQELESQLDALEVKY
ncbi:MAG: V-type ATP synthase subunit A [Anaerolineaceae bacterium]|nr:V-type ATP synthase subunit A [Anaerolineaceae bacterium]